VKTIIIGFPEYAEQTKNLAIETGLPYSEIQIHHFPDGESKLRLPESLPDHVILCRSLNQPNEKIVELILAAGGAKELGCKTLTLVAPYLAYMRQDCAFSPGEVVSQKVLGQLWAKYFDQVVTVDSHLHRIHELSEAIPINRAINLTATGPMSDYLHKTVDKPFLIGPDEESQQWVAAIAKKANWDYAVANKQRFGDAEVSITLPDGDYKARNIVLVDDVASTGKTLTNTAKALDKYQPASISVLVTHALFTGNSIEELYAAGVKNIWSCDSVPHPTNRVSLAHLLSKSIDIEQ